MRCQKNLNLKQYTRGIGQYLLTSQFVYSSQENVTQLKKLQLKIQTRKQKKIHYMYLWLLTKTLPYLRKFYPSWKNTSKNVLLKTKAKNHSLQVTIPQKNIFSILHDLLIELISKQNNSEKKSWIFKHHVIQVMIFSASITKKTYLLQTKNAYFSNLPLRLNFQFSNTTAFQKLFFLRSLKILSPAFKLSALDSLS